MHIFSIYVNIVTQLIHIIIIIIIIHVKVSDTYLMRISVDNAHQVAGSATAKNAVFAQPLSAVQLHAYRNPLQTTTHKRLAILLPTVRSRA